MELDFMVYFSSIASVWGSRGRRIMPQQIIWVRLFCDRDCNTLTN
ncbi:MAG: hypothetical protein GY749_29815 [Desulfobacteraceae bacterium]|nr:hypothetical protein [Desulfobacteraceae bacterium]